MGIAVVGPYAISAVTTGPVGLPTAIRFAEGFVGPVGPTSDPVSALGGQTRELFDETFSQ